MTLPSRITDRIQMSGPDDCWLWTGWLQKNGYASTNWKINGKWGHARVHRLVYMDTYGPIPEGLEVDHTCHVRACQNPAHLRAVTHAVNLESRRHATGPRKTHCIRGHDYATHRTPKGVCRLCARERTAKHRARQG